MIIIIVPFTSSSCLLTMSNPVLFDSESSARPVAILQHLTTHSMTIVMVNLRYQNYFTGFKNIPQ